MRLARTYSGRHKILARYRSYHGGTHLTMSLTGDPRRWPSEPASPGIIHVMDPTPYEFSFGTTDEELKAAIATLTDEGVEIVGASDHGVTHSLYIKDPDGNELELYIDVQPETWRGDPTSVDMVTRPLVLR